MNFYLEELKIDLQDTPVENIFITDFMPFADGTYVKVYLMGYKIAKDKENMETFNNDTIAKNLQIPLSDVLNAWTFWENQGIIKKHITDDEYNYSVEFINLKQLYIDKVYKFVATQPKPEEETKYVTNQQMIELNQNTEISSMHKEIETIFGKFLTINDKRKINQWLKQYSMTPKMMVQAFSYCVNIKKKRSMKFIEGTIALWDREGVDDLEALEEFLEKKEDRYSLYTRISKALGFMNRSLTEGEMRTIDKWVDDFGFSKEIILKALENSTKISNPNINYFDAILDNWHQKGYKTLEDVSKDSFKNKNNSNAQMQNIIKKQYDKDSPKIAKNRNKFHNFEQKSTNYSEQEMENLGRKNLEKKLQKLGITMPSEEDD